MDEYEQLDLFAEEYPEFQTDKKIRLITTFSGIGSQEMALKRLGVDFEIYKAVEFDKYAIASYNAIHGTNFPTLDIRDIHGEDLEIVDRDKYCYIMFYSWPCTDLSLAGKQAGMEEGSGTRSSLLWEVKRIIGELKDNLPDILISENVPLCSFMGSLYGRGPGFAGALWDKNYLSPTLTTMQGGMREPLIIVGI